MNKKALGAVVATSLLIVVAVAAIVGFQDWYQTFSSETFGDVDSKSSSTEELNIESIIGNKIYIKYGLDENASVKSVKVGDKECSISSYNLTKGINEIDLGTCAIGADEYEDVIIITDRSVASEKHKLRNTQRSLDLNLQYISPTPLDGSIVLNGSDVIVNVTSSFNLDVCNLYLNNGTMSTFTMNISSNYCYKELKNIEIGTYNYKIQVGLILDSQMYYENSSGRTFYSSSPTLSLSYVSPTPVNNAVEASGYFTVNVSADESLSSADLYLNSSPYSMQINQNNANITISSPGCGLYNYYVQAIGLNTAENSTPIRNVTFDIPFLTCTTDSDGDGFIDYGCANYNACSINATFEGYLDTHDSLATAYVDNTGSPSRMQCTWETSKSGCQTFFTVDGCGTGTVLDKRLGLCWQRNMNPYGGLTNWTNAKGYCENLILGGNSNWRMPTSMEFISLYDKSAGSPYLIGGSSIFQNVQTGNYYWMGSEAYSPRAYAQRIYPLHMGKYLYDKPNTKYAPGCVRNY